MTDQNIIIVPKADEKIIERIRKLYAMSNDTSSIHEAEIALKRCMKLMTQYGITEADLTTSEFGANSSFTGRSLDKWRSFLALGIAAFTNTIVSIQRHRIDGVLHKKVVFEGFDVDVQQAILLSDYLEQTLERCVTRYKQETGNTGKAASTSYRNGFAIALQERMVEMSKEMEEVSPETSTGTSLVVCKMKMVESEFGKQKISRRTSGTSDSHALGEGYKQGEKVNLNRQMSGGNQKALNAA